MFLEKMFGNVFGIIWLVVFIVAVLSLLIWTFSKKEKVVKETMEEVKKELIKDTYKDFIIEENDEGKFEILKSDEKINKVFDSFEDCKIFIDVILLRRENNSSYEIIEIDGFFKVRKKGNERTIRKFSTQEEAEDYVKEKESNDWSKVNR